MHEHTSDSLPLQAWDERLKALAVGSHCFEAFVSACKLLKTSLRRDRRTSLENLASAAETAAHHNNSAGVWKVVRALQGWKPIPAPCVLLEDGTKCNDPEAVELRWHDYFKDLFIAEAQSEQKLSKRQDISP